MIWYDWFVSDDYYMTHVFEMAPSPAPATPGTPGSLTPDTMTIGLSTPKTDVALNLTRNNHISSNARVVLGKAGTLEDWNNPNKQVQEIHVLAFSAWSQF